jgi:hypothetical protein
MAWRVQFISANGENSVENNNSRRVHGATMDAARTAIWAVGCVPQIGLAEIPLYEWEPQMRRGCKRRHVRGSRRRASSRSDDERWRGVHRHRRIHQAHAGNAGETPPTLDSQVYEVFLATSFWAAFAFLKASRIELKKQERFVMTMFVLLGVLVIDLFLVLIGDGTRQSR